MISVKFLPREGCICHAFQRVTFLACHIPTSMQLALGYSQRAMLLASHPGIQPSSCHLQCCKAGYIHHIVGKLSWILRFCGYLRKIGGVASFGGSSEQSAKVFSMKIYFPSIRESFLLYSIWGYLLSCACLCTSCKWCLPSFVSPTSSQYCFFSVLQHLGPRLPAYLWPV